MKQFNRSFVGLMEECNTGKWVLKVDADKEVERINQLCDAEMLEAEELFDKTLCMLNEENNQLNADLKQDCRDTLERTVVSNIKITALSLLALLECFAIFALFFRQCS